MASSSGSILKVATNMDDTRLYRGSSQGKSRSQSRLKQNIESIKYYEASDRHKYFKSLQVPSPEKIQHISAIQERKESENARRRDNESINAEKRRLATQNEPSKDSFLQPMLSKMSLSLSDRWVDAAREAYYRKFTGPFARRELEEALRNSYKESDMKTCGDGPNIKALIGRQRWVKVGLIVRRAGRDQDSNTEERDDDWKTLPENERELKQVIKRTIKLECRKKTKVMDAQYFLEMVDIKHRYGPNLRVYHEEWMKSNTLENFFLWLDYGEGSNISCQACSRERLERERVHYLSKEERRNYLVIIDRNGRLCWAKNGAHIDTSEKYCDSINGIVPVTDQTNKSLYATTELSQDDSVKESDQDIVPTFLPSLSHPLTQRNIYEYNDQINHPSVQMKPQIYHMRDMKKVRHISAAAVLDRLLRESVQKNTWIFVADTSFRLYIGIKKSGVFQHSSFLHGGRISAAGSIRVEDGKLSRLSPLSGHYRPPISNFRTFIRALKGYGVDTSNVAISHTYTILLALEAFGKTRRTAKKFVDRMVMNQGKLLTSRVSKEKKGLRCEKSFRPIKNRKLVAQALTTREVNRARNLTNASVKYLREKNNPLNSIHCKKTIPLKVER